MVLSWLRERLEARRSAPVLRQDVYVGEAARVDAKAEGDEICLGGWRPVLDEEGRPDQARSPWFAVRLTERIAPWAYWKGKPFKTISALELLATLVALLVLDVPGAGVDVVRHGIVTVRGWTDSAVATAATQKGSTMSFPLCVIHMELEAQLEARGAHLDLHWSPRTHNQEADDLTNLECQRFSKDRQVTVTMEELPFKVIPRMMKAGEEFYREMTRLKRAAAGRASSLGQQGPRGRGGARQQSLRETDPW